MTPALLHPRYWPTWAALAAARALVVLPLRAQQGLGRGLGAVLYRSLRRRRAIARTNLALCFPEQSEAQREALLRAHFEALGTAVFETASSWWASDARLQGLADIDGLEHLQAACARGRGVILLSAHFTHLELGGRLLAPHQAFDVLYRSHKNPVFDHVMRRARERRFGRAIAREDTRALVQSLRAGRVVWYAPDQDHGRRHAVFVPFFGVPAAMLTVTSRLADATGAAVVPFTQRRSASGRYHLRIEPAWEDFPSGDPAADAARIVQWLERRILEAPEQYLWVHRRFKTRPEQGLPGYYDRTTAPETPS